MKNFPGSYEERGGGLLKEDGVLIVHLRVGEEDGGVEKGDTGEEETGVWE